MNALSQFEPQVRYARGFKDYESFYFSLFPSPPGPLSAELGRKTIEIEKAFGSLKVFFEEATKEAAYD